MKKSAIYLLLFLVLGSCLRDDRLSAGYMPIEEEAAGNFQEHPGKILMETQCYACHSPTAAMDEMIAPPMAAVKAHYLLNNPSKGEFVKDIVSFVEDPSSGNSKMPGAAARFGIMPLQKFPENSLEQIAEYLYDYRVEEPEWFAEHWKAGPGKGIYRQQGRGSNVSGQGSRSQYEEKGIKIAMEAQQLLGQKLMRELQNNGTLEALEFCNLQAIPLTASVAKKFDASVQRVTDRSRNTENAANSEEKAIIEVFKREISACKDPEPILRMERNSVQFYYPLITNNLCLQCHGKQEDMEFAVKEKILELYPQDKATGYEENEVRGIWKIVFKK